MAQIAAYGIATLMYYCTSPALWWLLAALAAASIMAQKIRAGYTPRNRKDAEPFRDDRL